MTGSDGDSSFGGVTEGGPPQDATGGGGILSFLRRYSATLRRFLRDPKGFILTTVLSTFITMFVITPTEYALGFLAWGVDKFDGAVQTIQSSLADGFDPFVDILLGDPQEGTVGVFEGLFLSMQNALAQAGLGAPIASTLTAVIFAAIVTVILYVLIRVAIDALPGGGGLLS